jgi:ParB family chromosome partitioning protein
MGDLRSIPLSAIRENPVALRSVNRTSEEYQGLVQSIREKGFLGAITVRARTDEETGQEYFELVDGLHRFSASKDADLEEINVDVVDLDQDEVLEAQIMANIHKVETKPVEYSKQLRTILARRPLMTEAELAKRLGKSSAWIKQRLGLNKIANPEIQTLINEGKINLSNAYPLAKLPPEEQPNFVDRAMTLKPDEFVPQVNKRVKEIRDAKRKGKDAGPEEFQAHAYLQKAGDVKAEFDGFEHGLTTAQQGWDMAISWCLHMDPDSQEGQKVRDAERKAEKADQSKKNKAEAATKKAKKAQEKAAEAALAAEAAQKELAASNS